MKRVRKRNRNRYLSCAYINEKQVISGTVITMLRLSFVPGNYWYFLFRVPIVFQQYERVMFQLIFPHFSFVVNKKKKQDRIVEGKEFIEFIEQIFVKD